jgi:L-asparaginase
MAPRPDGSGVAPALSADDLVDAVPQLQDIAEISPRTLTSIPGANVTPHDLFSVADEIVAEIDAGAAGVLIIQGTDTMEETSFVLDLLLGVDAPVVVTGAMRHPSLPGADGPANLVASSRVAVANAARGLGVTVVMNDEIHAAAFVQKRHTSSPAAFASPGFGPLGGVVESRVRVALRPSFRSTLELDRRDFRPVALVGSVLGDHGRLLSRVAELGYEGLVVEAFGGGHVAVPVAAILKDFAASMPVVLCSRTRAGDVLTQTYAFEGAEIDLLRRGVLHGGWLTGLKARLLLGLLLGDSDDLDTVAARFSAWLGRAD